MYLGDIVYIYLSDKKCIRFKTEVVAKGCERGDNEFWNEPILSEPTYKLEYREEYNGHELDIIKLKEHGLKTTRHPFYNNKELFDYIDSIFKKQNKRNIIDEVCTQDKTRLLVRKIIPILIRWAKQGITSNTYKDLTKELGYDDSFSGIGVQLAYVDSVISKLKDVSKENIPTLNVLVNSKRTNMPSEGFSFVYPSYENMSIEEKQIFVFGLKQEVIEYERWDWVLSSLGLSESNIDIKDSEKSIRSGKCFNSGGEGIEHKTIKEFIYNHPESLGIENVQEKVMEYILLSGDRLDVFFKLSNDSCIAVEVKPSSSPDDDILRGLFQYVKYKTIMDAENKIHCKKANNTSMLVIGGKLSTENKKVRDILGIKVIEDFHSN